VIARLTTTIFITHTT